MKTAANELRFTTSSLFGLKFDKKNPATIVLLLLAIAIPLTVYFIFLHPYPIHQQSSMKKTESLALKPNSTIDSKQSTIMIHPLVKKAEKEEQTATGNSNSIERQ